MVQIALPIPDLPDILWLGPSNRVPGTHRNLIDASRKIERRFPEPPGPGRERLQQGCRGPGGSFVNRKLHPFDGAFYSRDGIALKADRPGCERFPFLVMTDDRLEWQFSE